MQLRRIRGALASAGVVFAFLFFTISASANAQTPAENQNVNADPADQPNVVLSTIIEGQSIHDVAQKIWQDEPNAAVFVPEGEVAAVTGEAPVSAQPVQSGGIDKSIELQQADTLNTVLVAFDYGYGNLVYLLSPQYSWLQSASLVGVSMLYLQQMELKLGRWSLLLQKGGRAFAYSLNKLGLVKSDRGLAIAEKAGNFITHAGLIYVFYGLFQALGHLPNLHDGFFSSAAQINALRKGASGYLSGVGWAMLNRKWDALPDSERPISRQAFTTFNNARGLILGMFVPFLIGTSNNVSWGDFILKNSAFVVSAVIGAGFYFWGDSLMARFPQIARSLDKFQGLAQKLNSKLTDARNKIRDSKMCSLLLKKRTT